MPERGRLSARLDSGSGLGRSEKALLYCAVPLMERCLATLVLALPRRTQTALLRAGLARERTELNWR